MKRAKILLIGVDTGSRARPESTATCSNRARASCTFLVSEMVHDRSSACTSHLHGACGAIIHNLRQLRRDSSMMHCPHLFRPSFFFAIRVLATTLKILDISIPMNGSITSISISISSGESVSPTCRGEIERVYPSALYFL